MKGYFVLGASVALLACGSSRSPVTSQGTAGDSDGPGGAGSVSAEGGNSGAAAGEGAGDATVDLSLEVVRQRLVYQWAPADGAQVRIEGAGVSLEVESGDDGVAKATVPADSGPWDITVALAGVGAVSILGVTEPLSVPVHLGGFSPPKTHENLSISGSLTGRSWPGSVLSFSAPSMRGSSTPLDSYSARLEPGGNPSDFHVLVSEWDSYDEDATPLNALWLDVPKISDKPLDVVLPTPPRSVARTRLSVALPSSGLVLGKKLVPQPGATVSRRADAYDYKVGRVSVAAGSDADHYKAAVDAFTDDMGPNEVELEFASTPVGDSSQQVLVAIDPSNETAVSVPPVEQLEENGATLDELEIAWSAPAYTNVGASVVAWGGAGWWYTYSFSGNPGMRRWPSLPSGVTRQDIGLDSDDFQVNVFAISQVDVPWNWEDNRGRRAVVVSTRLPSKSANEISVAVSTGPLNAYDGIYTLTNVTMNPSSCSEEGPSILDPSDPSYLVVVGIQQDLSVGRCSDVDDCRALATAFWSEGTIPWPAKSWLLRSNFPQQAQPAEDVFAATSENGVCTGQLMRRSTTTAVAGSRVRFDLEMVDVPSHPADNMGNCPPDLARAAAKGVCSKLEVYTGTFYEAL